MRMAGYSSSDDTGALKGLNNNRQGFYLANNLTNDNMEILFNASWSNNIYVDNGKVYPASIALNFIIKT